MPAINNYMMNKMKLFLLLMLIPLAANGLDLRQITSG
jgi:hypothetical protein